ncbi:MAG: outer membrane protein assembly factor BamB, partial [Xanthomonadales bacterium]|nr:outer membrane protein assembly factor BamB [Xanthomonadales bacterium]
MRKTLLLLLALSLVLPGCAWVRGWGDPEPGDPAELVDFDETLRVKKIWSTSIGAGLGKQGIGIAPRYVSGTIYAADYKGRITAVNADNGNRIWEKKTDLPLSGGPGVEGSLLVMGTLDGQVLALDAASGNELWTAQVSSEVLAAPAIADGIVIVRCIDGRVFGLDQSTGNRLWIHDRSVPLLTLRGNAQLLIRAGTAFVGYDDGAVVALRVEDGAVAWEQSFVNPEGRTELDRLADVGDQMMMVATDLIVSSYKNRVTALAAESGRLLWFKDIASATGVTVDRVNLATSDKLGHVWLLDRRNGSTLWKQDQLENRGLTRPAIYGGLVVVGDAEGYLHWMSLDSGRFAARTKVVTENDVVYLLGLVTREEGDAAANVARRVGGVA